MHHETFYTKKDIKDLKLALISDIHYYPNYNQKILNRILKQIKNNKPDYICIAGDILDTTKCPELSQLFNWLEQLSQISPIIAVLGNHDEKCGSMWNWTHQKNELLLEGLKKIKNFNLLDNNILTFNNISFYGFNATYKYYEKDNESFESFEEEMKDKNPNFNKDNYNITLFHSPINIYNYIAKYPKHPLNDTDLILSGHMHNGCIPYFITNPFNKLFKSSISLINPLRQFFRPYSQGRIYKIKDGYIYEGINKFSHSTKLFHKLDFIYQKNVQFITIKKQV